MAMAAMGSFEESPLGQVALEKAKELFGVCDREEKGFIIKKDMQRLASELPGLTPDQLEEVFDSLDQDHNGFLTMDEFVRGFGAFLGLQLEPEEDSEGEQSPSKGPSYESGYGEEAEGEGGSATQEKAHFDALLEELGAADVFKENRGAVETLWSRLRHEDPSLLANFEAFLSTVSGELRKSAEDFSHLESALNQRSTLHDDEIRKLYEEMEGQIRTEKQRVLFEERTRAEKAKEDMERELEAKDAQLQDVASKAADLEARMAQLAEDGSATAAQNDALQQERQAFADEKRRMEAELDATEARLGDAKEQLEKMKKQAREERKARAQASFKVTENIANERESLVQQLDSLRSLNRQLKDERDSMGPLQNHASLGKQDSSLAGLLDEEPRALEDGAAEEEVDVSPHSAHQLQTATAFLPAFGGGANSLMDELGQALREEEGPVERAEPVGEDAAVPSPRPDVEELTPERIFKVVFVGDSGVGKTCFLHRFCHERFKPSFSATIGVDFQVKSLKVEGKLIALQLWDTAGQERFRSITKQYFRKADGVILMFDLTSEQSFLNLRNWMLSVREGVDPACVLAMVGNKLDVAEVDGQRAVSLKDGQRLAEEYEALYYEGSAQSGVGVSETMQALAILLREREDQHLQDALRLEMTPTPRKKGCCGR